MRRFSQWLLTLALVAIGIFYLNSVAYSAWMAGGPPTAYPEAWAHRSFAHLFFALAAFVFSLACFRFVPRLPRLDRLALVLAVFAGLLVAAPAGREFLLIDACLDGGGQWKAAEFRCLG